MASTEWATEWVPVNGSPGAVDVGFEWRVLNQSIEGNYSNVQVYVTVWPKAGGSASGGIGGTMDVYPSNFRDYPFSGTLTAGEKWTQNLGVWQVPHGAGGTGSVLLTFTIWPVGWASAAFQRTSFNRTVALPTIPRATQITADKTSVTLGEKLTFSLPRASSSFTHLLEYQVGDGAWTQIASGVGTSYEWTVPLALATQITDADQKPIRIACTTKNGSTTIGSWTAVTVTGKVPDTLIPTLTSISVVDAARTLEAAPRVVATAIGAYVQGVSRASVTANGGAGIQGSTITGYEITVGALDPVISPTTVAEILLSVAGSITISVKAVDSRSRKSAARTQTLTVIAYAPISIDTSSAVRANSAGNPSMLGTYIAAKSKGTIDPVTVGGSAKNKLTRKIGYRKAGTTGAFTEATPTNQGAPNSWDSTAVIGGGNIAATDAFEVRFTAQDLLTTMTRTLIVAAAQVALSIGKNNVGVGKTADRGALDVGGDTYVDGTVYAARVKGDGNRGQFSITIPTLAAWGAIYWALVDIPLPAPPAGETRDYALQSSSRNGAYWLGEVNSAGTKLYVYSAVATGGTAVVSWTT